VCLAFSLAQGGKPGMTEGQVQLPTSESTSLPHPVLTSVWLLCFLRCCIAGQYRIENALCVSQP
jgi:hypothetical protein